MATAVLWKREMLSVLRKGTSFAVLLLMTALLLLIVMGFVGEISRPSALVTLSTEILAIYFSLLLAAVFIVLPPMTATALVVERERNCLEMLLAAPLRVGSIVRAKALAALSFFLLLAAAGLPVVGMTFFLVGVDWPQFAAGFLLIFLNAFSCIGVSLAAASGRDSSSSAVLLSALGVLFFLIAIPAWYLPDLLDAITVFARTGAGLGTARTLLTATLYHGNLGLAALIYAAYRLARPLRGTGNTRTEHQIHALFGAVPAFLAERWSLKNPILRGGYTPVLSTKTGRREWFSALFLNALMVIALSLYGLALALTGDNENLAAWFSLLLLFTLVLAPPLIATRLPREREKDTFDMLRMTLLTPNQIVFGHLGAAALARFPVLLGVGLGSLFFFIRLTEALEEVTFIVSLIYLYVACSAISIPLYLSTVCRTSLRALVASYVCIFLFYLGTFICSENLGDDFWLSLVAGFIILLFITLTAPVSLAQNIMRDQ